MNLQKCKIRSTKLRVTCGELATAGGQSCRISTNCVGTDVTATSGSSLRRYSVTLVACVLYSCLMPKAPVICGGEMADVRAEHVDGTRSEHSIWWEKTRSFEKVRRRCEYNIKVAL
jgi:hypothetical protein